MFSRTFDVQQQPRSQPRNNRMTPRGALGVSGTMPVCRGRGEDACMAWAVCGERGRQIPVG